MGEDASMLRAPRQRTVVLVALLAASLLSWAGSPATAASSVGFGKSLLAGASSQLPTSLQFGPDGRLYVADMTGAIRAYTVERSGRNRYAVTATEVIGRIAAIPNHDDDGTPRPDVTGRMVTGLLVVGTAANPQLYVTSNDPRRGGSAMGDVGLDTNSGTITRLRWDGARWRGRELVRGLPRSEEVHLSNGMALDPTTKTLFVAIGGNTNMGAPSVAFAGLPEYALSAAIVSVDLGALGSTTYDLPTLDDPDRPGAIDGNDPFGGNDGANQARIVPGGPVQVYSPGYRNAYDLVRLNGRLYATDNGPNEGAGGLPSGEGTPGCTNAEAELGITAEDSLHLVEAGDYGGHPNPTRGNVANTFGGASPVPVADPRECTWLPPGPARGSLATFVRSVDGIDGYTATNFSRAMKGDLLIAAYSQNAIIRVELNAAGDTAVSNAVLFANVAKRPLDLTAQGANEVFPGTIWVADQALGTITVFEPNDYGGTPVPCSGLDDPARDDDADGFTNADEFDNGTDPCSAGDVPADHDNDRISNLNDPDDDDDGAPDTSDPFAWDPANGTTTTLPVNVSWDPVPWGLDGIAATGFTGLMTDGVTDYEAQFDPEGMAVATAAGTLSIDAVGPGTAAGAVNTQRFGFQRGLFVPSGSGRFRVVGRMVAPFGGLTPEPGQAMGVMLGTGGQDDYAELTVVGSGSGAVRFRLEVDGQTLLTRSVPLTLPGPESIDLSLVVDPVRATVLPRYAVVTAGVPGTQVPMGPVVAVPRAWVEDSSLAIGLIATSAGASPFPATWDFLRARV
jgi:glucose/arabinose dehydrogenase